VIAWPLFLTAFLGLLLLLMALGVPVFVAFLMINVGGVLYLLGPAGFGLFANSVYETATSPSLSTIPLFILLGEILFRSGSVKVLFSSVDALISRIRGRLYVLVVALSTLFGALSGSAVAVAAMLGRSVLPDMLHRGYSPRLAATTIMAGASLAPIIPPSLFVIVIGSLVNDVSIAGLLVAGIMPGLLLAALTLAYVSFRIARNPRLAPPPEDREPLTLSAAGIAIASMLPFGIIIFSVMGLILLGIATPTESAATGVLGAVFTAAIYRQLSLRMLIDATVSTASISAMILVILASSKLFSQLLAFTGATGGLVSLATGLDIPPWQMFILLMVVPLLLCMFLDQIAFMLLAVPLYVPIVTVYGFDPIWFWTIFLINLTIGSITPPFGYTLYAMKGASKELSMQEIFMAALPVVSIFLIGVALVSIFPFIITWLPQQL
jgi:tripartite ATP-independent transporter DctM subunit